MKIELYGVENIWQGTLHIEREIGREEGYNYSVINLFQIIPLMGMLVLCLGI